MSVSFISALMRFRIMPITIACLSMMFAIKLYDLATGTSQLSQMLLAGEAIAVPKDAEKPAESKKEAPEKEKATAAKEKGDAKKEDAPADTKDDKRSAEPEADKGDTKLADKKYLDSPEAKQQFSRIELDILQSLAARREQITKWEEDVRMKENLLGATEARIGKRIEEINTLEKNVRGLLEQYEKQEDANIRSLVKIYENMKPKEAARIFNELEMPVLLMVVDRMSERKAAPVLAKMTPTKAKELTVELAEQRKMLNDTKQALDNNAVK